jgi:Arc/MetJ-type ribon-helix-helix transcriptional regulator
MKQKISISIDEDTLSRIKENINQGKFRNISHAFEYAVNKLGDNNE